MKAIVERELLFTNCFRSNKIKGKEKKNEKPEK
jgi:hypothetical protein